MNVPSLGLLLCATICFSLEISSQPMPTQHKCTQNTIDTITYLSDFLLGVAQNVVVLVEFIDAIAKCGCHFDSQTVFIFGSM